MSVDQERCRYGLHCLHLTERIYPSDPPLRDEVCCHCNFTRQVQAVVEVTTSAHGPYLPKRKGA